MPRKTTVPPPGDDEIMSHSNVPVDLAARYIGWSSTTIYYALQDQRAPFGFAVKSPKGGGRITSVPACWCGTNEATCPPIGWTR